MPAFRLPPKSLAVPLISFARSRPLPTPNSLPSVFCVWGNGTVYSLVLKPGALVIVDVVGVTLLGACSHVQRCIASVGCQSFPEGFLFPQAPLLAHS